MNTLLNRPTHGWMDKCFVQSTHQPTPDGWMNALSNLPTHPPSPPRQDTRDKGRTCRTRILLLDWCTSQVCEKNPPLPDVMCVCEEE